MSSLLSGDQQGGNAVLLQRGRYWTDRSKARRASPEPLGSTPQDEDMFDPADIHTHSTPESRGSNANPRSGDSRGRGLSPNTLLRITDDPVPEAR